MVRLGGSAARSLELVPVRFVIIGGGPGGNTAATVAASLGAEVTLIERDIIGGAAHLWDCIPSKAMVATGNELAELARANTMGLEADGLPRRRPRCATRIAGMEETLRDGVTSLLESQGVRLIRGTGRLTGAYTVAADDRRRRRGDRSRRDPARRPARGRACPSGRRSTASASSRPARRTRRPRSPSTSS